MKRIFTIFFCTLVLLSTIYTNTNSKVFAVQSNAVGSVVIEASSGRVLFEKNKDKQLAMASTTKIMTALVAIENTKNLDEVFATDNRAVGIEGTSIYLRKDEHLSMRDLLFGLMLASGNDAALAIAYKVGGGDLQKFVDMMNQKVDNLGLKNTHFDNPHGLDSKSHYTSAYDLAMITAKAMQNDDFKQIVSTKFKQIPSNKVGEYRYLKNKHRLLQNDMLGCEGVKTGFTDNARRCCVTSVMRGKMRLICVVLNCQDMFVESQNLIENCFERFQYQQILEANKYIDSVAVNNGKFDNVKVYTKDEFYYPLADSEIQNIQCKTILPESVDAPIKANTEIGEYKIYLNNDLIFVAKIYTINDVTTKDYGQKLKDIVDYWY